jgi:hypothetical protein
MARRMAQEEFRLEQERDRYAAHVRPVNELVDELRDLDGRGWMPHVAPSHGGVEARVLSVLRDPGPKAQEGVGSGFLCWENDDPTAEQQCVAFADVGIAARDITPWNAYPWYINRAPTAAERDAGVGPLVRLVALMPHLRVILLQGGEARDTWRRLIRRHPRLAAELSVVETFHPGRQALWSPDPAIREQRRTAREAAYRTVAALI